MHGRRAASRPTARRYGPADVAAAIADVVRAHEAAGTAYDLVLLGNDAADTGDFQVGIRLAYALDRPVVTGISTLEVDGRPGRRPRRRPRRGTEIFEVPLPAVLTVMEGGVEPRYPSIPGRMKAKKVADRDGRTPTRSRPARDGCGSSCPPEQPSQVKVLGNGAEARPRSSTCSRGWEWSR